LQQTIGKAAVAGADVAHGQVSGIDHKMRQRLFQLVAGATGVFFGLFPAGDDGVCRQRGARLVRRHLTDPDAPLHNQSGSGGQVYVQLVSDQLVGADGFHSIHFLS